MFGDVRLLCSGFPGNVEKSGWLIPCIRPACPPPRKKHKKIWCAPRGRPTIALKRKMGLSAMMAQGLYVMFNASLFLTCLVGWRGCCARNGHERNGHARSGVNLEKEKRNTSTTTTKGLEVRFPHATLWISLILAGDIIVAQKNTAASVTLSLHVNDRRQIFKME